MQVCLALRGSSQEVAVGPHVAARSWELQSYTKAQPFIQQRLLKQRSTNEHNKFALVALLSLMNS